MIPIHRAKHYRDDIDFIGSLIGKDDEYYGIAKYKDSRFVVEYENVEECLYEGNFEVIGIQK